MLIKNDCADYCTINWKVLVAVAPPEAPVTVMVYVPFGVPGLVVVLPELLPPQEAIHRDETPSSISRASRRIPRSERLRDPAKTMPISPGNNAA